MGDGRGHVLTLFGRNGVGKSTTARLVATRTRSRLLAEHDLPPVAGSILVEPGTGFQDSKANLAFLLMYLVGEYKLANLHRAESGILVRDRGLEDHRFVAEQLVKRGLLESRALELFDDSAFLTTTVGVLLTAPEEVRRTRLARRLDDAWTVAAIEDYDRAVGDHYDRWIQTRLPELLVVDTSHLLPEEVSETIVEWILP